MLTLAFGIVRFPPVRLGWWVWIRLEASYFILLGLPTLTLATNAEGMR